MSNTDEDWRDLNEDLGQDIGAGEFDPSGNPSLRPQHSYRLRMETKGDWEREAILYHWQGRFCRVNLIVCLDEGGNEWVREGDVGARSAGGTYEVEFTVQAGQRYILTCWYKEGPPNPDIPWKQARIISQQRSNSELPHLLNYVSEFEAAPGQLARITLTATG